MPEEEVRNASTVQEGTSGSAHASHTSDLIDAVQKRTEACEKLVEIFLMQSGSESRFEKQNPRLLSSLQGRQHRKASLGRNLKHFIASKATRYRTWPENKSELTTKQSRPQLGLLSAVDLHKPSETSTIPRSLLDMAPHLAQLQSQVSADPHIAKSWELRQEYGKERIVNSLIDLGQLQRVKDPISWKLVIMDHYVDFEKLYATLDKAYDHNDEPKDFMGGFSLVKKDHAVARHPISSESDWSRTFDAWMAAVI
ncbi:hypothetical protein C0993_011762, partial [Termitomyces sp. T159_Od127]